MDIIAILLYGLVLVAAWYLFKNKGANIHKLIDKYEQFQDARFKRDVRNLKRMKARNQLLREKSKISQAKARVQKERHELMERKFRGFSR